MDWNNREEPGGSDHGHCGDVNNHYFVSIFTGHVADQVHYRLLQPRRLRKPSVSAKYSYGTSSCLCYYAHMAGKCMFKQPGQENFMLLSLEPIGMAPSCISTLNQKKRKRSSSKWQATGHSDRKLLFIRSQKKKRLKKTTQILIYLFINDLRYFKTYINGPMAQFR